MFAITLDRQLNSYLDVETTLYLIEINAVTNKLQTRVGMRVSLNWLKESVDINMSFEELERVLAKAGFEL